MFLVNKAIVYAVNSMQPFYLLAGIISVLLERTEGQNLNDSKIPELEKQNKLENNLNKPSIHLSPLP